MMTGISGNNDVGAKNFSPQHSDGDNEKYGKNISGNASPQQSGKVK